MKKCLHTGKTSLTQEGAKNSAKKFKKSSVNGMMFAYKCMFCDFWHITHQRQRL